MLRTKTFIYLILIVCNFNLIYSQAQFKFENEEKRAVTLKYKSVNNLIILSVLLNGELVNFLLDSGVNKTKVFGKVKDSTLLKGTEYISLRSLGSAESVRAYRTKGNHIDFGPISGDNQEIYYITDPRYDLSSKLGVNVQGIIGYEFFKDFIIRFNYNDKKLKVYQHDKFNRKLQSFSKIDFRFIRKKPHIKIPVQFLDGSNKDLVFLIDTGSSDAFWVFANEDIKVPDRSFPDYVGYGLEMAIEGRRSKFESVKIGEYKLEKPRATYIDSSLAKLFTADRFKNGIIGSEVLRRFVLFFDYKHQNTYLKPSTNFNDHTNYDRSGLLLNYVGEEINKIRTPILVKINKDKNYGQTSDKDKFEIRFQISKILQVAKIRPNSPASKIDIQTGDRILKLNRRTVDRMSLEEINTLLSSEEGKRIKILLKRDGVLLKREIFLSSQFNWKLID